MAEHSPIEWTNATWNPVVGCSVVSPGCTHCYAMKLAGGRLRNHPSRAGLTQPSKAGPVWTGKVRLWEPWLTQPFDWKTPGRIFVCAHGDLFHEGVADETIDKVFAVMALSPQHTFQVLTKRAERMRAYFAARHPEHHLEAWAAAHEPGTLPVTQHEVEAWLLPVTTDSHRALYGAQLVKFPLPNVWLGVSAEDQPRADERIGYLLDTPAAIRFVSLEPLLGAINVLPHLFIYTHADNARLADESDDVIANPLDFNDPATTPAEDICTPRLDWVIAGGESGKGARPMHPDWVRSLRDQCAAAQVPFFFKQWGEWAPLDGTGLVSEQPDAKPRDDLYRVGKKRAGALLDGKMHREFPTTKQGDGNGDV